MMDAVFILSLYKQHTLFCKIRRNVKCQFYGIPVGSNSKITIIKIEYQFFVVDDIDMQLVLIGATTNDIMHDQVPNLYDMCTV